MQIIHITLIFTVQIPVAYISRLVLLLFNILYVCFFCYFLFFFKVNSGVFLHNRVATLMGTV